MDNRIRIGLIALAACACWAQQDMGVITGLITDRTAAVVPGATVTVTNRDTNEIRTTVSNQSGAFSVGPLRVGTYNVAVEKPGFKRERWDGIEVHAQDRVRADFQLDIGEVSEMVAVTAEAPVLQAETSSLEKVVEEREIRELPLNSRNFQQLAWLSAGVSPDIRGRDRDSGFTSHGQPFTQNSFIVDGIDNNNNVMGMQDRKMQVIVPSLDAVAEFKVTTSNYSAEFGRNSGALMLVNIKSGSNQFHGSAYEYVRNDVFDARDTFNYVDRNGDGKADPERLRKNLFGATIGGPVRRNRAFFFFSWERLEQRQGQADLVVVPTLTERAGIFDPKIAIKDPLTGKPFSNNQIPQSRIDPVAAKLVTLYPEPNFAGTGSRQNYARNPPWNTTRDQYDARVDDDLTASDKFFVRASFSPLNILRDAVLPLPARGAQGNDRGIDDNKAYSAALSHTHIFSPALLNEFRYGFIRQFVNKRELDTTPLGELTAQYGIKGIPPNPLLFGLPSIQLNGTVGYVGIGEPGSIPNRKTHQVHQFLDNVSWNRGKHNWKFGADLRWNRSDIFGGASSHGQLIFDGSFTGVSLADFLLGDVAQATLTTQLYGQMRFQNYMFYALDDWKITRRLTLNLGLRYELTSPWIEKHNHMNKLELAPGPDFGKIVTAGACGDSWRCRALMNPDYNNVAPRLGLAWQATPKTVVRGGAGVFYGGQGALGADQREINNFPYNRSVTLTSSGAKPAFPLSEGFPPNLLSNTSVPPTNANWAVWAESFPEPMIYQWNVAVQREMVRNLSLTLAYVGSASTKLMDNYNLNGSAPGNPATERQRRLIPQWNNITFYSPFGHASYHGLDVQLERRLSSVLSFSAAYTWSHSLDNMTEQFGSNAIGAQQDFHNMNGSRSSSAFDVRNRFVSSFVYELPAGKGRRFMSGSRAFDAILGGWQLSGVLSAQSGYPFTISLQNARQLLGATAVGTWRPDRIASGDLDRRTPDRWFDTSAFALPRNPDGSYRFGNEGRAILTTDRLFNLDAGLMKAFPIRERARVQFRWEVFNITNTPEYGNPNLTFGSPDFGKVRGTDSTPRQMQFAIRATF